MLEPDPALALLWRHVVPLEQQARRGPKQKVTLDEVVDTAITLADRSGLAALTMRGLAAELGLGAMSIYTYVPGRNDLIVLMVDAVIARVPLPALPDDPRARLALVARVQYADYRAHPWLLDVTGVRAFLGPGVADRYEWQLRAVDDIGLDDIEMDQTVTLLVGFAASVARAEHALRAAEAESGMTDLQWWEANAAALGTLTAHRDYPLAGRVGSAAGEAYQAATDPARELEFGLARIVDGIVAYLERG